MSKPLEKPGSLSLVLVPAQAGGYAATRLSPLTSIAELGKNPGTSHTCPPVQGDG